MNASPRLRIAFIHPGLGLGGAARLAGDAAWCLQSAGHDVTMFTASHNPARSMLPGAQPLRVRVHGGFVPKHIGQRLQAPLMIARMAYVAVAMARSGPFDLVFCDLVAQVIPLLRLVHRAPVVFYCHFPDLLLAGAHERGWLYRAYRLPIDHLEAYTMGRADRVLVNSEFTARVFRQTFPRLHAAPLDVVYPGVDVDGDEPADTNEAGGSDKVRILSINRFVRTKNIGLAIDALAQLRDQLPAATFANVELQIAGAYDAGLTENYRTLRSLQTQAQRLDLHDHVVFLLSVSDSERRRLLSACRCVVYTPVAEHFGYGPVEAMASGRAVVAVNHGGPLETVRHGETGFLCPPTPAAFAEALYALITDAPLAHRLGAAGRRRVVTHFSRAVFGARLDAIVRDVVAARG